MITLEEVKNISFRKSGIGSGGYRCDDVDDFIDEVVASMEYLAKEVVEGRKKADAAQAKLKEYQEREASVGQVLLGAQRQADTMLKEAALQRDGMLVQAQREADELLAHARDAAQNIEERANGEIEAQREAINTLRQEVVRFKAQLLGIYREHLTLIDALPGEAPAPVQEEHSEQPVAAQPEAEQPEAETQPQPEEEAPSVQEQAAVPAFEPEAEPEQPAAVRPGTPTLFDDDYEVEFAAAPHMNKTLKFGDDYSIKADRDETVSIFKKRK